MPPVIRKRGKPKGHLLTTIGLPSKKKRSTHLNHVVLNVWVAGKESKVKKSVVNHPSMFIFYNLTIFFVCC